MAATKTRSNKFEEKEEKPVVLPTKLTGDQVLACLGRPIDLASVEVHRYDASRCRVNVKRSLTKETAEEFFRTRHYKDYQKMIDGIGHSFSNTLIIITDSFYLRTNYDGSLRSDNPAIEKMY
jgi:hypothetical protein